MQILQTVQVAASSSSGGSLSIAFAVSGVQILQAQQVPTQRGGATVLYCKYTALDFMQVFETLSLATEFCCVSNTVFVDAG